jgi:hypothetical protein
MKTVAEALGGTEVVVDLASVDVGRNNFPWRRKILAGFFSTLRSVSRLHTCRDADLTLVAYQGTAERLENHRSISVHSPVAC